jgi:sugar/nucleoside kinase (ribokinase family)
VTSFDLLVIGDVNPDVMVEAADLGDAFGQREQITDRALLLLGGSAAITAIAAARLGARVAMVGCTGDDWIGAAMVRELTGQGIECRVQAIPGASTSLTVIMLRGGDRAIITADSTLRLLDSSMVPADLVAAARHVHVGGYFLQPGLWDGLPDLFRQARAHGATTSLDPNWDPAERWAGNLAATLPLTDVFLPNLAEARLITGEPDPVAAGRMLAAGGGTVAIKLGMAGALACRGEEVVRVSGLADAAVDATGAGDNFDAGFLAGLLNGYNLRESLGLAVACGSLSTQGYGGTGVVIELEPARAAAAGLRYRTGTEAAAGEVA